MRVAVRFYSYFKELAGAAEAVVEMPEGCTLAQLVETVLARFPKLAPMKKAMLVAVDVEYQAPGHVLQPGEVVSLFPPVQGG